MDHAAATHDDRQTYEMAFELATRYAARFAGADEARDVAHDVAVSVVQRRLARPVALDAVRSMNAFIYRAVVNRLIDRRREGATRATAEMVYVAELLDGAERGGGAHAALEAKELARVMDAAITAMPPGMRSVFLLVRDHDRSYKEVAAELGVGVGTVHTQLSRAYALLRDALDRYRTSASAPASADTVGRRTRP